MIGRYDSWCVIAAVIGLVGLMLPLAADGAIAWGDRPVLLVVAVLVILAIARGTRAPREAFFVGALLLTAAAVGAALSLVALYGAGLRANAGLGYWLFIVGLWIAVWRGIDRWAGLDRADRWLGLCVPAAFGLWIVFLWEVGTVGFGVPNILLPPPSAIAVRFMASIDVIGADVVQTFFKAVLAGYALGCASAFVVAVLVDRSPFLQRGLLPFGNFVSALPIVGVAPIMVMWFGFDWPSKAAVVVVMTFFPMLVNTIAGLAAAGVQERELLQSYGASYWQGLIKLRLPAAMPMIFNALKINSTLALIGAIVAEFFGTPIVGMGFRISTEVGRMNIDMVWAEIIAAALLGSAFYGIITLAERLVTFWHPSYHQRS